MGRKTCTVGVGLYKEHWYYADGIGRKRDKKLAAQKLREYMEHLKTCPECQEEDENHLVKLSEV